MSNIIELINKLKELEQTQTVVLLTECVELFTDIESANNELRECINDICINEHEVVDYYNSCITYLDLFSPDELTAVRLIEGYIEEYTE